MKRMNGILGVAMAALLCFAMTTEAKAEKINLVILLDQSGSIGSSDFNTVRNAIADAIDNVVGGIPVGNTVNLSLVKFSTGVTNTSIIQQDLTTVDTNIIRNTSFSGGTTSTWLALDRATSLYDGSADKNIINIVTDGEPFKRFQSTADSQALTVTARNGADAAGYDEISAEFIGSTGSAGFNFLKDFIIYPTNNGTTLGSGPGFIVASDFASFQAAFTTKLQFATGQITATVPEPGTYALFGLAAAGYAVIRRRRRNVA